MSPRPLHLPLLALVALPAACRSTAPTTARLETRALEPAQYEAQIVCHAVSLGSLTRLSAEADADASASSGYAEGDDYVELHIQLVNMEAEQARQGLGWSPDQKQTLRVDREAVARWLQAEEGLTVINTQDLVLPCGELGAVAAVRQVAYLDRFELVEANGVVLADPMIEVANAGVMVQVRAAAVDQDGFRRLELEMVSASLEDPIESRRAAVPGMDSTVQLHIPITTSQRLATSTRLSTEDALILGGLPQESGGYLFAVVVAEAFETDEGTIELLDR